MLFSSLVFLTIFLPLVLIVHWSARSIEAKNIILLIFSLLFYAWGEPIYVLNMVLTIFITYYAAIYIDKLNHQYKLVVLALSISSILGLLFYYKYFNFVINNINVLLDYFSVNYNINQSEIIMPIGISFYSFQAISYIIDVYKKQVPSQRNFLYLALYISLFPQLIAGPIVRYKDIFQEIFFRKNSLQATYQGSIRFIQGLAKKVLLANTFGEIADHVFALPSTDYDFVTCWLGAICYSLQLYFDFSGYSDMAIGLGRMFGFNFLENFNYPYISKSITEFWRRWHISLSSWFRDYVYIPLGGNRVTSEYRVIYNIFIVFLLTGIWHGANWTFIIWGLWHGFFVITEKLVHSRYSTLYLLIPTFIKHLYAMLVVVIGWVLFRSDSLLAAGEFIQHLFIFDYGTMINPQSVLSRFQLASLFLGLLISIGALNKISKFNFMIDCNYLTRANSYKFASLNLLYLSLLLLSMIFLIANSFNPFIYFRF